MSGCVLPKVQYCQWEAADVYALNPPAEPLEAHWGLLKAKSSLLIQVYTGAIGLQRFLFCRQVPGFPTPLYSCSKAPETVAHLLHPVPAARNR